MTAVAGANAGTITRTAGFEQSDSRGSFKLAVAADPASPAARNILVYQGSKVYGALFTSETLAENKSYNTVYQLGEYVFNTPAGALTGEFSVSKDGGTTIKKIYFSKGNLYAKKAEIGSGISMTSSINTIHFQQPAKELQQKMILK
mgnify:CR=1 FL=1